MWRSGRTMSSSSQSQGFEPCRCHWPPKMVEKIVKRSKFIKNISSRCSSIVLFAVVVVMVVVVGVVAQW